MKKYSFYCKNCRIISYFSDDREEERPVNKKEEDLENFWYIECPNCGIKHYYPKWN